MVTFRSWDGQAKQPFNALQVQHLLRYDMIHRTCATFPLINQMVHLLVGFIQPLFRLVMPVPMAHADLF